MHIATEHAGVNINILTGADGLDPISGNAILNGIPVKVKKAAMELALLD